MDFQQQAAAVAATPGFAQAPLQVVVGNKMSAPVEFLQVAQPTGVVRDARDGHQYATVEIAGMVWMAWHRDLSSRRSGIWRSPVSHGYSLSVRCVRSESAGFRIVIRQAFLDPQDHIVHGR